MHRISSDTHHVYALKSLLHQYIAGIAMRKWILAEIRLKIVQMLPSEIIPCVPVNGCCIRIHDA